MRVVKYWEAVEVKFIEYKPDGIHLKLTEDADVVYLMERYLLEGMYKRVLKSEDVEHWVDGYNVIALDEANFGRWYRHYCEYYLEEVADSLLFMTRMNKIISVGIKSMDKAMNVFGLKAGTDYFDQLEVKLCELEDYLESIIPEEDEDKKI